MDIRCTSTGRTFYQFPTDVAALLLEAFPSVFEKAAPPAPANAHTHAPARPSKPTFVVADNRVGVLCVLLKLPTGEIQQFSGHPDHVLDAFHGYDVPKAVVEEYKLAYAGQRRPVSDAQ